MDSIHFSLNLRRGPADDLLHSLQFQAMLRVYGHITKPFVRGIASGGLTGEFQYRTSHEMAAALESIGAAYLRGPDGRTIELVMDDLQHVLATEGDIAAAIEMLRAQAQ